MKVLLATDGSQQATVALETAVALLRKDRTMFDLLCVAPDFTPPKARREKDTRKRSRMIESYRERIRVEAREMLVRDQASLAARGIEPGIRTEIGSPARVIVRLASDYDLTVIGAHDNYTRGKQGLGPVAARVVASASNAALIGREAPGDKTWRILAAVDGSLASERALNFIGANLNVKAAEITVMHVVETPWIRLGLDRNWFESPGEMSDPKGDEVGAALERDLNYEADDVVDAARRLLEKHGLSASTMIIEGDPGLEIISEAERGDYDLIVLGATGESRMRSDILGDVSAKVAQDASCSVLVAKFI